MRIEKKQKLAQHRRWRVRKKVTGTNERPRMSVTFTNKNIHVQFIDDVKGATLVATSTIGKSAPDASANVTGAKTIGGLPHNSTSCNGTTFGGITEAKAAKIWYRALTTYFTTGTTYAQARVATLNAATDLYGAASAERAAVATAWSAVSVN